MMKNKTTQDGVHTIYTISEIWFNEDTGENDLSTLSTFCSLEEAQGAMDVVWFDYARGEEGYSVNVGEGFWEYRDGDGDVVFVITQDKEHGNV